MKLGKVFLLLTFIILSAQTLLAQAANNNSSVKIEIKNYTYIVSGVVSSEAVKNEIVKKVSEISDNKTEFSQLKVVSTAAPFAADWQKGFDKSLFKSRLWKSGVFIFTSARPVEDYPNVPYGILNEKIFPVGGAPLRIADYENKTIVLFFLASWCAPCVEQAQWLDEFYAEASASGVEIIGINADSSDADEEFKKFVRISNFKYKMAAANKNLYEAALKISKFPGIPQAFLIRDGKLYGVFAGNAPKTVEKLREVTLEVSKMR